MDGYDGCIGGVVACPPNLLALVLRPGNCRREGRLFCRCASPFSSASLALSFLSV